MSAMSCATVLAIGIWIVSILIPWCQEVKSLFTNNPQSGSGSVTNASHKFTENAQRNVTQATAKIVISSSPKARARKTGMRERILGQAPSLYEYGGRLHISPFCSSAETGLATLSFSEPCSQCTSSRTPLAQEELYRTNKGEKYHTRNCHHIQSKLARGAPQAYLVRALTACRCVVEHYQQPRQLEVNYGEVF